MMHTSDDGIEEDRQLYLELTASVVLGAFHGGDWEKALSLWQESDLSSEEILVCWSMFGPFPELRALLDEADRKYLDEFRECIAQRNLLNQVLDAMER